MASNAFMQIEIDSSQNGTGWQSFTFSRQSRVILGGMVNGERIQILLDSGAEQTLIDRDLAARLKLRQISSTTFSDRRSVIASPVVEGPQITFGSLHIDGLSATAADFAPIKAMTGLDVGVLLGREIFEEMVVDIDFARERIAFSQPEGYSPPPGAASAALDVVPAGHRRAVEVVLEDKLPVRLEFDLGSASAVILQQPFWKSAKLTSQRRVSNTLLGGAGGIWEAGLISLSSVTLAGFTLQNVDALLEPPRGVLEGQLGNGTIGIPIWSKFRVIADYSRDRLYLIATAGTNLQGLPRNRAGLRVIQEGPALRVLLVARHSPAERAGWRRGEKIIAVDGHPIDATYWASGVWRWAEAPAETRVVLTLSDGSARELELSDYY